MSINGTLLVRTAADEARGRGDARITQPDDLYTQLTYHFHRRTTEPVDKSESLACYPRRAFDPLSKSPSTRDCRIAVTDVHLWHAY